MLVFGLDTWMRALTLGVKSKVTSLAVVALVEIICARRQMSREDSPEGGGSPDFGGINYCSYLIDGAPCLLGLFLCCLRPQLAPAANTRNVGVSGCPTWCSFYVKQMYRQVTVSSVDIWIWPIFASISCHTGLIAFHRSIAMNIFTRYTVRPMTVELN